MSGPVGWRRLGAVLWWLVVIVETVVCGWVDAEHLALRRARARLRRRWTPLHRFYGLMLRSLAQVGRARQQSNPSRPLELTALRRRTGWLSFGLTVVAMAPLLAAVLVQGRALNPVLAQLLAWALLWSSPLLTAVPVKLATFGVAVWRGWVRIDDGRNGGGGDDGRGGPPVPDPPLSVHEYPLAR
jgi:hypothetical protein